MTLDAATIAGLDIDASLARLRTSTAGLSATEAASRLQRNGANVFGTHRVRVPAVLWSQLRNPLLLLLMVAAAVSGVTGESTDALIIGIIIVLSVGLGFVNEYRAEVAVEALHSRIRRESLVWRDERPQRVDVTELVVGDVVELQVGDLVPADLRILEANELECDEGVLTGESLPVEKSPDPVAPGPLAELSSCAFMGTIVHEGAGRAVVFATGTATAFGKIAVGLTDRPPETAFQAGLRGFSRLLVAVAGVLTVAIFAINIGFARPFIDALLFSLAIAVGITPEMMPAIVTVSLSAGSRELAKQHVLVKRLVTIEDLGNIQLLFTDKTGTLTEGAITFDRALDPSGGEATQPLLLSLVCNDATMSDDGPIGGNSLDQALWRCDAGRAVAATADGPSSYERVGALPFDHERQMASVVVRRSDGSLLLITKGGPEAVMARCLDVPSTANAVVDGLFRDGARVVAIATRQAAGLGAPSTEDERDLALQGFLTFVDRPKPDAGASIAELNRLGIDVKIITGDNGAVAEKVCRDIGVTPTGTLVGSEIDAMDDKVLGAAILAKTIFARVSPDAKSRIIKVARSAGTDVAFLGDGVNDAVALHHADVGISVDSGTDVAKDAADIVLLDKDLAVLAKGVMEGRRIFANTLKYVLMATSSNFGNMFSAAGASLVLTFLPMLPSQILLNNLLYNTGQLAIPTDRVDPEVLDRPAVWDITFVRRFMSVFGPVSSIFDFLTFMVMLWLLHAGHSEFRTGWFVESIATQTLVIYVIRTRRIPFLRSRPSRSMVVVPMAAAALGAVLPWTPLRHVLGFSTLPFTFFVVLVGMIVTYLLLVELAKSRFYGVHPRRARPPTTERHRLERRIRRRAAPFMRHYISWRPRSGSDRS